MSVPQLYGTLWAREPSCETDPRLPGEPPFVALMNLTLAASVDKTLRRDRVRLQPLVTTLPSRWGRPCMQLRAAVTCTTASRDGVVELGC